MDYTKQFYEETYKSLEQDFEDPFNAIMALKFVADETSDVLVETITNAYN